MAKRTAAKRKAAGRKVATTRRKAGRTRSSRKRTASAGRKTASAGKTRASARKKSAGRKTASARKKTSKNVARARKAARIKRAAPVAGKVARRAAPIVKKRAASATKKAAVPPKPRAERAPVRTAPGLNRERRTIRDDDIVQTPPSSLDFDRSASAARSGRRELRERYAEHTETGPALTGGDVDADWESAYSVGDEAPGGDNPTPDQDLVDDIGRAVGIEYQDNEELKGDAKIAKRDRNRWELDPASSDDWDER
jgi:hypothetical protein